MTSESTQQLEDFHLWTYQNGPSLYEDEDAVRNALDLSVENLGLSSGDEVVVSNTLDNSSLLSHVYISDLNMAFHSMMADAYFGITAANLAQYKGVLNTLVESSRSYAFGSTKFGEAVIEYFNVQSLTSIKIEPSKVPQLGTVLGEIGLGVAVFSGIAEVAASENPELEGIKQGLILGAGIAVTTLAAPALAGIAGVTGGAALAALVGGVAGIAIDSAWGTIENIVNDGLQNEDTPEEIAEAARTALLTEFDTLWNSDGQDAQDLFDDVLSAGAINLAGIGDLNADYDLASVQTPDWVNDAFTSFNDAKTLASPLVLDLGVSGIELTSFNALTTTTFFDIDTDGFAEQTAWVGANDGLLAIDINENGRIDDASELFGSATVDGFAILAELDSNGDLIIDANDAAWSDLVIWQDADGDAVTDAGELASLSTYDIVSIDLAGVSPSTDTIAGNPISHESTFKYANGTTGDIVDAWFVHDNVNTWAIGDYTLDEDVLFLPALRGFGKLPSLHWAMSEDEDLLDLVEDFVLNWTTDGFANPAALDSDIEDILLTWAGADGGALSRGIYIDARHLEFLEELFGEEWFQFGNPNPQVRAAEELAESWDEVFTALRGHLVFQAGGSALFAADTVYNAWSGEIEGSKDLVEDAINDLVAPSTETGVDTEAYWINVALFLHDVKGLSNLTSTEEGWLNTAIQNADNNLSWTDIEAAFDASGNLGIDLDGDSGNNTLNGSLYHDILDGLDGNDTLNGYAGNDELYGRDGDDILNPGLGGDFVYGGDGNDTYVYTGGDDFYTEYYLNPSNGYDKIKLPQGITLNDLTMFLINRNHLFIEVGDLGSIEIGAQFSPSGATSIDEIEFYDTSTYDLLNFTDIISYGTNGDDSFSYGLGTDTNMTFYVFDGDDSISGGDGDDIFYGGAGNDILRGHDGNDTFFMSEGFDEIWGADGTDTVIIPDGYTIDDTSFLQLRNPYGSYDMTVQVAGLGQFRVTNQFFSTIAQIEKIEFAETNTVVNVSDIVVEQRGDDSNNTIDGITIGASLDNILNGMAGDDALNGGDGDDIYIASAGLDTIQETSGTDTIQYGPGVDLENLTFSNTGTDDVTIVLNSGTDEIEVLDQRNASAALHVDKILFNSGFSVNFANYANWLSATDGDANANTIIGSASADDLAGNGGNDELHGMAGNDILHGNDGDDQIHGGTGDDTLWGEVGDDRLWGGDGSDIIVGGGGDNDVDAGNGDDMIYGSTTNETIDGGDGSDWIMYSLIGQGVTLSLMNGTATTSLGNNTVLQNIENAHGSIYTDTIDGDDNPNLIDARSGDDTVNGNGGDDIIDGHYGNDTLHGNDGNDELYGDIGNDTLYGDAGNDLLSGEDGNDILYGGGGDDTLIGVGGDDELYGGDGNDTFYGFSGDDVHDGGNGVDLLTFYYAGSGVTANMSTGVATWGTETNTFSNIEKLWGSLFSDTLTGDNLGNEISGSTGNDILSGLGGNDTVTGGLGTDAVYGGDGSDLLYGGGGDDLLYGGADADYLIGNAGEDTLTGGSGGDYFAFFGSDYALGYEVDTVTDFNTTDGDVLEFSDVLSFDPLIDLITDFLQITDDGTDSFVAIDVDGGADNFVQIAVLESVTGLTDEQQLYNNGNISVL